MIERGNSLEDVMEGRGNNTDELVEERENTSNLTESRTNNLGDFELMEESSNSFEQGMDEGITIDGVEDEPANSSEADIIHSEKMKYKVLKKIIKTRKRGLKKIMKNRERTLKKIMKDKERILNQLL